MQRTLVHGAKNKEGEVKTMASHLQTSRRIAGGVVPPAGATGAAAALEYIISARTKSRSVYPEPAECKQRELALQGMHFSQWQLSHTKLLTRPTFLTIFRAETREAVGAVRRNLCLP